MILGLFLGVSGAIGVFVMFSGTLFGQGSWDLGPKVGVVELVGPIADSKTVVEQIYELGEDPNLVGLVMRIDSPGGGVAASQAIHRAMRDVAKKKPVVASMGGVAASGGFWVSLGADWVFAESGSITGSIGVISQNMDLRGLAKRLEVDMRTYKSGPLKDAGNPFREMTEHDEAMFQALIDDVYAQFLDAIVKRRALPVEAVKPYADGRVFTGQAAVKADLIDEIGGLYDAAKQVVLLAKVKDGAQVSTSSAAREALARPKLVYPAPEKLGLREWLLGRVEGSIKEGVFQGLSHALNAVEERADDIQLR